MKLKNFWFLIHFVVIPLLGNAVALRKGNDSLQARSSVSFVLDYSRLIPGRLNYEGGLGSPTQWNINYDRKFIPGFAFGYARNIPFGKKSAYHLSPVVSFGFHRLYVNYIKEVGGGYPYTDKADFIFNDGMLHLAMLISSDLFSGSVKIGGALYFEWPFLHFCRGTFITERLASYNQSYRLSTYTDDDIRAVAFRTLGAYAHLEFLPKKFNGRWGFKLTAGRSFNQILLNPNYRYSFNELGITRSF